VWGYRENDRLGGKDPYSASKAAAEIAAGAYRETLLAAGSAVASATARGGNVIGGGDWSEDRLVPDAVRALLAQQDLVLRNPSAVRPWQHVLELCRGYLQLGRCLLDSPAAATGAWNFGPERDNEVQVGKLVGDLFGAWGPTQSQTRVEGSVLRESNQLRLDSSRARHELGWCSMLGYASTLEWTAEWYRRFHENGEQAHALVAEQIERYVKLSAT
jgi:CDP-glucose 4,6-dehydratase